MKQGAAQSCKRRFIIAFSRAVSLQLFLFRSERTALPHTRNGSRYSRRHESIKSRSSRYRPRSSPLVQRCCQIVNPHHCPLTHGRRASQLLDTMFGKIVGISITFAWHSLVIDVVRQSAGVMKINQFAYIFTLMVPLNA